MTMKNYKARVLVSLITIFISACGGGSGDGSSMPSAVPPTKPSYFWLNNAVARLAATLTPMSRVS